MHSLEAVWKYREETLLPALFGAVARGIFPLEAALFADTFGQADIDPRWLHLGVFEFAPTAARPSWLYATSGGSTPWETDPADYDPDDYSWLGVELVMETPAQADWAVGVLQRLLAFQVLLCHGHFGGTPLDYGHRVPAGGPIDGGQSPLRHFALSQPTHYPATAQLPSGRFDLLHVVGISEAERDFAQAEGTRALIAALQAKGAFPVTDPQRPSILG